MGLKDGTPDVKDGTWDTRMGHGTQGWDTGLENHFLSPTL
jgi:hypothetical protein